MAESKIICSNCRKTIDIEKEYHYNMKVLCEDCCIDIRTPRVRKTHWQYLGSIKANYLIPAKSKAQQ